MAAAAQFLVAIAAGIYSDDSSDEEGGEEQNPLPRIPFTVNELPERRLFQQTRLDRRVFIYVLQLVTPFLPQNETRTGRYVHLTPMHKLYVTLQFYASGSFQWLVGSSGRISQSAASKCISEVTAALVNIAVQFVRFPLAEEYDAVKLQFYQLGMARHGTGFPNVLGVIDCTHCRLQKPTNAPEQYFNRHLYHSINVQLIAGPDLKIYNVFAEYPGANHDSYIWRNSAVREGLAQGTFPEGWLVGDSGYPQELKLMTPVGHITTEAEQLYNSVHISTRNPIERTNGVLKSRWRVLDRPLAYEPGKVCSIIVACCVLHNICSEYNLDVEDPQEYPLHDDVICREVPNAEAANVRQDLIARHFTR